MARERMRRGARGLFGNDLDMDKPFPADEEVKAILELGLARNKAEQEKLKAHVALAEEDRRMEAERVRLGYRRTTP